ncbi:hypothetical protein F511_28677 [Dorcoceras hygrometricum]|uniref:Uncharacterized protein n=1 Tax=Dorcoceras hygrometricum TaxID=472368 RepID=A0A2Z7D215_9LAMI|nr:hypothetical protein F511_28677 [Dorcoceras hygrometricum]
MLRPVGQSRVEVNADEGSVVRCFVSCVLHLDDQQLVLRIEHPMRRRLDKLVRRRFEDQSMRWTPLEKLYHPTPFLEAVVGWSESTKLLFVFVRFEVAGNPGSTAGRGFNPAGGATGGG